MGYTHYWTQTRDLTAGDMGAIAHALQAINDATEVLIAGWDGSGEPEMSFDTLGFNGCGNDGHETFRINAKRELPFEGADRERLGWAFCKTARKPYDIVVTAMLTILAAKYGFDVGSDGRASDWDDGVKLASKALGEILPNPIKREAA
jgi:hypothetical protein